MQKKFIKVIAEDGSIFYEKSRYMTPVVVNPDQYRFKDNRGNFIEPTELELELYNESQTGGTLVTNGWLTFIGIVTLINLIMEFILIAQR